MLFSLILLFGQCFLVIVCLGGVVAAASVRGRSHRAAYWCCLGLLYVTCSAVMGFGPIHLIGSTRLLVEKAGDTFLQLETLNHALKVLICIVAWEIAKHLLLSRRRHSEYANPAAERVLLPGQQQRQIDEVSLAAGGPSEATTHRDSLGQPSTLQSLDSIEYRTPSFQQERRACDGGVQMVSHDAPCKQQQADAQQYAQSQPPEQHQMWTMLPESVFMSVLERLPSSDQGKMRGICTHWLDAGRRTITHLKPNSLPAQQLVTEFPTLKSLDLSTCTKDISPHQLSWLRHLPALEDVTLGCHHHHRTIASTVTDQCLAELAMLTNLKSLNISQCVHVGDGGMMMVAQLTNLKSLEMPWCVKVSNIGLHALSPLTKLESLNISGCQLITEQGISGLAAFKNLEKLSMLNLAYNKICVTDAALEKLSELTKLRSLNIGSTQVCNKLVTDRGMKLISSNYRQLTQLGLMSLDITDAGMAMLAQLTDLQALNIRGCSLTSAFLKYLSTLTCITDLCLMHNAKLCVDDACLASLAKLPKLQVLGLGNFQEDGKVSDTCLVPLESASQLLVLSIAFFTGKFGPEACSMFSHMASLRHLDLHGSQHADAALLQAVGQLTALQSLHLNSCSRIGDAALQHITALSSLHTLNISACHKVTDVGLAAVTKLQGLTQLLAQQCRDVTDAGVAQLGRLTKLQILDLSACERITGCGFQAFQGCKGVVTLSLSGCSSLNDGGLRAIGRIVTLNKLYLSNCQLVTDVGVSYLKNLAGLTSLDLAHCIRVGDAAMAAIASSMRQLATLKVNSCLGITDLGVNDLCHLTSLSTLHLDRCVHITDLGLSCLSRLTALTSLRLSRCHNITDSGVAQLSKLSRLSTLSLAQCPRVTDAGLSALAPLTALASLEF